MRPFLTIALTLSLVYSGFAQPAAPEDTIRPGTEVEIELLENISSETLQVGQSVSFKLVRALGEKGETLLAEGTTLTGKVTSTQAAGPWGRAGAFDLKLEPLKLPDGTLVRMDFHRPTKLNARGEKTDETVGKAIVMTYYFPLIPAVLIAEVGKGKPFKIRAGERYLVYVTDREEAATGVSATASVAQKQSTSPLSSAIPEAGGDRQKVFVFVQRTDRHIKYSSAEVFHDVLNDLLGYLNVKKVAIALDEFGGRNHSEGATPLDTIFTIARDVHASSVMYVVVDRPLTKWLKITVQCFDINEQQLWKEEVSSGGGISGGHGFEVSTKKLHAQLDKRLGQVGLPLLATDKQAVAEKQ